MTKLTVLNGGNNKLTDHIYEVHDNEGYILDVLRFDTPEDAKEFQGNLTGEFYVKPHTLPIEELLDIVLDIRIFEVLDKIDEEDSQ